MDRFVLLRLPTVALKEVLKCLNPIELYHLSQCSRKMAKLIPLAGTKKILLEIDFDDSKIVMNKSYVLQFRNELSNSDPDTFVFHVPNYSHWKKVARLRILGFNVSALFKCPIKSLEIGYGISRRRCRSIIEQVLTTEDSNLENLDLNCDLGGENLKWILEKTNVTGKLKILTDEVQNISVDLKLNCRHFMLDSASWITVDNLVSLTSCVTIQLFETKLTYQVLDVFMKKWKSGLFPNLEYMWVHGTSFKNDGQILGFSEKELRIAKDYWRYKFIDDEYYGTCAHGVDVKNDDGINGSIRMNNSVFEFFVWKD